jgi:hypothetical protein
VRIFTDNTALQAAHRTLTRSAQSDGDVEQLFSLVEQIIFCRTISVSGFEPTSTLQLTEEMLKVLSVGFSPDELILELIGADKYASACKEAGRRILAYLRDRTFVANFEKINQIDGPIRPAGNDDISTELNEQVHNIIMGDNLRYSESQLLSFVKEQKVGTVLFAMASNDGLIDECRKISRDIGWNRGRSDGIHALIRAISNEVLAGEEKIYMPSYGRQGVLRQYTSTYRHFLAPKYINVFELSVISDTFSADITSFMEGKYETSRKNALRKISVEPGILLLPSLLQFIIPRAMGTPKGIIDESLELRARMKDVRSRLSNIHVIYEPERWASEVDAYLNDVFDVMKRFSKSGAMAEGVSGNLNGMISGSIKLIIDLIRYLYTYRTEVFLFQRVAETLEFAPGDVNMAVERIRQNAKPVES